MAALNSLPCRCSSSSAIPAAGIAAPPRRSRRRSSGRCPGRFAPVICDPLRGPTCPGLLRWFAGLYGPCIRLTPWLWWLVLADEPTRRGSSAALRRTIMAPVYGSVARAVEA